MSGIFNSFIFNNAVFNTGTAGALPALEEAKPGGGGIEVYKPTGLVRRKKLTKAKNPELRERLRQQIDDQIEITSRLREEFTSEPTFAEPIETLSMEQIEAEIGVRIREKIRSEEEELLLLLVAVAGGD